MVFILNLVIILLIIICFVLHCFFIDFFFFFTFHNSICDWLGSLFFYFFRFAFNEITQPHDLGHRFERLARVNFYLFLKYFFSNIFFFGIFFRFAIYGVISFSCHVFDLFTRINCQIHSRFFFYPFFYMFPSYWWMSILYIFMTCSTFYNIFLWCEFIQSFSFVFIV